MDAAEAAFYLGRALVADSGQTYRIGQKIGDGGFAGVFAGTRVADGQDVAVKVLSFSAQHATPEFRDEIAMLATVTAASNIITLFDHGQHPVSLQSPGGGPVFSIQVPFMVLERAAGSLDALLVNRHQIAWTDRLFLFREMVKGVHQMHLDRLVHRDVKSENGLVFERGARVRVTDLGRSKNTRNQPRFPPIEYEVGRGDIRFAPPDLLWRLGDDTALGHLKTDLYLVGSLLYEIATATGMTSVALGDPSAIIRRATGLGSATARENDYRQNIPILRERYEVVYDTFRSQLPFEIAYEATALLRQLTDPDPDHRPPHRRLRGLPVHWDLQWLLIRIDILRRRLETEERKRAATLRKKQARR